MDNEAFLKALLLAAGSSATSATPTGPAGNVVDALRRAAQTRTDYRVPRLLAGLAQHEAVPIQSLDDETLADLLERAAVDRNGEFLAAGGVAPGELMSTSMLANDE